MSGLLLPSGRQHGLPFVLPDDWSPDQALAVVELLGDLLEVIWNHYQIPLQEMLRKQRMAQLPFEEDHINPDAEPF